MVELIKTKSKSSVVQSARVSRVIEIAADKDGTLKGLRIKTLADNG